MPRAPVVHRAACRTSARPGGARCHARIVVDSADQPLTVAAAVATPLGYAPQDLQSAYGMVIVPAFQSTPVIAIVDAYHYPNALADLNTYRAQWGIEQLTQCQGTTTTSPGPGPCFNMVDQNGGGALPAVDSSGWSQESALDLQMASAMCPACTLILVEANSATYGDLGTAVSTAALALLANVISTSYGGSETGSSPYEADYDHPGLAITASAGDSGYGIEFPASSPHVVAVGGTRLTATNANARGWTESVWNDSYGSTGSGCSTHYTRQAWQTGVLTISEQAGCAGRVVADVSAVADPATGVAVFGPTNPGGSSNPSGWMVFGGTSAGSPLIAGMYAAGFGVTLAAPIYASAPYAYAGNAAYLNDVTSGSNVSGGRNCGSSQSATYFLCHAMQGFDGPTGLGTPNGYKTFAPPAQVAALPDSAEIVQDTADNPIAIAANDVNFTDPVTLTVIAGPLHGITAPAEGAAGVTGTGGTVRILYTPAPGYSGTDGFTYQIRDATNAGQAQVAVNVLADSDGDGIPDVRDNCSDVSNSSQLDSDGDDYGNACDADFDNNGVININDFNRLKASLNVLPVVDVATDLDGNGAVNVNDLNRLKSYLGKPPGPSGFHSAP